MPRTKMALIEWGDHLKWIRHRKRIKIINNDVVFCHIDGTPIKNFNRAWWRALEIARIDDFHFHDLRHTFCSNLVLSGSNLKVVKELIGHNDISMTDRYSHLLIKLGGTHKICWLNIIYRITDESGEHIGNILAKNDQNVIKKVGWQIHNLLIIQ